MNILKFNFKPTVFTIKGKDHKIKSHYVDLILSFIVNRMISTTDLQNGYVEIPSKTFRLLYDNYWVYIAYLIEKGIIERKPYSVTNHTCYGYRFCYQFIRNLQITEVILNNPSEPKTDCKEIPIEDQAFVDYKIIQRLKSDFLNAEIDITNIDRVRIENTAYVDAKKYFYNVIQLFKWKAGNEHIYYQWISNRLYTNFTFLSSHYRVSNVKLNNEPIFEFDITSSFAIMLAVYCIQVNPYIVNDNDFKEYCTSIKQKSFYEDLTESLNITKDCDSRKVKLDKNGNVIAHRPFTKDIVKRLFQIFINGNTNRVPFIEGYSNSFVKEQFALKYPCIYEIIDQVKSNNEQIYYKLSKIESEFIVGIVEDLYNKVPEIKILTCHDALYLPISYKDIGEEVWNSHMESLLNNLPDNIVRAQFDSTIMEDYGMYEDEDEDIYVEKRKDFNCSQKVDLDIEDEDNEDEDDFDWFYN
ncbi:MAG: hypothetical protein PHR83_01930 [Paludibacter sp.]|nr:hypothetical protein [Paludibacter sp.]